MKRIKPNQYYNISDIHKKRYLIILGVNRTTITKYILKDANSTNILRLITLPGRTKRGNKYKIKGEYLINYIQYLKSK